MKKFLKTILFLCALSSLAYGDEAAPVVAESTEMSAEAKKDAMKIMDRMRDKIKKEEELRIKAQKEAEEQAKREAEAQAKALEEAQKQAQKEEAEAQAKALEEAQNVEENIVPAIEPAVEVMVEPVVEPEEVTTSSTADEKPAMDSVQEMLKAKKSEEVKPKTTAEKLEATRKKAMSKLDFYERVVRSVAREENEIADYYEIMGEEKARPSITDVK